MKAQKIRQEDHDLAFPLEKVVHLPREMDHLRQGKSKEPAFVLDDRLLQRDMEVVKRGLEHLKTRNERIEEIKMQVNAGTYRMSSIDIAQKMVESPLARNVLDDGCYGLKDFEAQD